MNKKIVLILILLAALFFRFYNIHSWTFFGMDQEYEAFLVTNILSLKHFPLIGVNAGDTGLYLGPAFIYFAALPYAIFQGNPLGGALFGSIVGVLTTVSVYLLGRVWGPRIGLVASLLYAASFVAALYDRQFWNPSPVPLATVWVLYSLIKAIQKKPIYLIVTAFCLGFLLQSHLQAVLLLFVVLGSIIYYRKKLTKKYITSFFLILLLFQTPLIIFDLRHNFTNTKALINLSTVSRESEPTIKTTINERYSLLLTTLGRALYVTPPVDLYVENGQCSELVPYKGSTNNVAITIVILSILYFVYQLKRKENRKAENLILTGVIVATFIGLLIYNRRIYEYYFLYLLPIIYICISYTGVSLFKKNTIPLTGMLLIYVVLNAYTLTNATMTYSFKNKLDAIAFASKYTENYKYNLEAIGECGKYGGYSYLFEYFGKKPNASYMDPYFAWIYGNPTKNKVPKTVILSFIDPREGNNVNKWKEIEKSRRKHMIAQAQFGNILVMIVENE